MNGNESKSDDSKKVVIELRDVKRDFLVGDETVHALRGVSFKIYEGEFVTIMGKSGSGKSTLLNQLGCLDTPTSGEYFLDGVSVRSMSKSQRAVLRNRKIGFIFQNYNLLPKTTSVENVELPLMYNPEVSAKERRERAIAALKAVGLGDRLYHMSNQMSGGQMQRVAIARALVNNPAVILADEATGNLDTRTSFEILVLFQKLHAEVCHHGDNPGAVALGRLQRRGRREPFVRRTDKFGGILFRVFHPAGQCPVLLLNGIPILLGGIQFCLCGAQLVCDSFQIREQGFHIILFFADRFPELFQPLLL